jgi:hypothetical protein
VDACIDEIVVPDRGGHGQDALGDAGEDAGDGAGAVVLDVELALESVVDGLDDLPQWFEEPGARAGLLAFAGRAE